KPTWTGNYSPRARMGPHEVGAPFYERRRMGCGIRKVTSAAWLTAPGGPGGGPAAGRGWGPCPQLSAVVISAACALLNRISCDFLGDHDHNRRSTERRSHIHGLGALCGPRDLDRTSL